jgi:hypothetical protein
MLQFWGGGRRTWGLLCGSFGGQEAEDMGVVLLHFWGGRLGIWVLLCGSFGAASGVCCTLGVHCFFQVFLVGPWSLR